MSTSLGMTSPSPSVSTKLVAFPRFPTLPVRPERKLLVIRGKTHNKRVVNVMYRIKVNKMAKKLQLYRPILCTYSSTSSGMS